jgi:hypothetical protein
VTVGDVQGLLNGLAALLAANQGEKPASEFQAFCAGLEPFKHLPVRQFAQVLRDAAGQLSGGAASGPASPQADSAGPAPRSGPASSRSGLHTKDDAEAVARAVAELKALYDRFTDPTLTPMGIEAEVERLGREFDVGGLKAVARGFGITSGIDTKIATKKKLVARIVERKGRHDRSAAFSAGVPAEPPPGVEPPLAELVAEDDPTPDT